MRKFRHKEGFYDGTDFVAIHDDGKAWIHGKGGALTPYEPAWIHQCVDKGVWVEITEPAKAIDFTDVMAFLKAKAGDCMEKGLYEDAADFCKALSIVDDFSKFEDSEITRGEELGWS